MPATAKRTAQDCRLFCLKSPVAGRQVFIESMIFASQGQAAMRRQAGTVNTACKPGMNMGAALKDGFKTLMLFDSPVLPF